MAIYQKGDLNVSRALQPVGSGIINVTQDYTWTLSKNRAEVPSAFLTEYQINSGQLLAGMYYYYKQVPDTVKNTEIGDPNSGITRGGGEATNPYEFMYFATETGFTYNLPYLGDAKFGRTNTFTDDNSIGNLAKGASDILKKFSGLALATQGSHGLGIGSAVAGFGGSAIAGGIGGSIPGKLGLNNSKSWDGTSGIDYTIDFDLLNTFLDTNEIRKNRELAFLLTHQASPFRRNFAVMDPPCIYQLSIPDVVHLPACYISQLTVTNLGNTRLLNLDGQPRSIPEAYRFSLTFSSLIEESRNIFQGVDDESQKVRAISLEKAYDVLAKEGNGILEAAENVFNGNGE